MRIGYSILIRDFGGHVDNFNTKAYIALNLKKTVKICFATNLQDPKLRVLGISTRRVFKAL